CARRRRSTSSGATIWGDSRWAPWAWACSPNIRAGACPCRRRKAPPSWSASFDFRDEAVGQQAGGGALDGLEGQAGALGDLQQGVPPVGEVEHPLERGGLGRLQGAVAALVEAAPAQLRLPVGIRPAEEAVVLEDVERGEREPERVAQGLRL